MKLSCPACGATASLDVLIGHEGARDAVVVALSLYGPLGKLLVQYLGLFRPAQRQLSMDRVASLLAELKPMIQDGKIARSGRICSAPQDYWKMAIEEMIAKRDTLRLPLKNHGYLFAIIEGYGNKAGERAEKQHEDRLAGRTPVGACPAREPEASRAGHAPTPPKPRTRMPADVLAAIGKSKPTGGNDGNS